MSTKSIMKYRDMPLHLLSLKEKRILDYTMSNKLSKKYATFFQ